MGRSWCEHGRQRSKCKECGGRSICEHGRLRSECKECGGTSICEHGRLRRQCKQCKECQLQPKAKRRKLQTVVPETDVVTIDGFRIAASNTSS